MMTSYWISMAVGAVLSTVWLWVRLKKRGMKENTAFAALPVSFALGFAAAKLFYVVLLFNRSLSVYGLEALVRMKSNEFSFFGGCVGACLGMALTAKAFRLRPGMYLDAFAPAGALMVAFARFSEKYLDMLGTGKYTDSEFLCRFPFAVSNEWGEWYLAIFMLEALAALVIAVIFTVKKREDWFPLLRFLRVAFYLCVVQIFLESLRSMGLKWGFVRVEQLLSGVAVMGVLLYHCLKLQGNSFLGRFWPVLAGLCGIAALVGIEFGLDRTELPDAFWYAVMVAVLAGFGWLEIWCVKKRFMQERMKHD